MTILLFRQKGSYRFVLVVESRALRRILHFPDSQGIPAPGRKFFSNASRRAFLKEIRELGADHSSVYPEIIVFFSFSGGWSSPSILRFSDSQRISTPGRKFISNACRRAPMKESR